MDQDKGLKKLEGYARHMKLLDINTYRLALSSFCSDRESAGNLIEDLEEINANKAFFLRTHFRRCNLCLAVFALSLKAKTTKYRKKSHSVGKKMLKLFITEMKYGNVNAYPIVSTLEAEESPSKDNYENAIKACARLGLIHHEAYMCEQAAAFFHEWKDVVWTRFYIGEAFFCMRNGEQQGNSRSSQRHTLMH